MKIKIIALFIVGLVCLIPPLGLAETCPTADSITINKDFTVKPPSGYKVFAVIEPISATGPIKGWSIIIRGDAQDRGNLFKNVHVDGVECTYYVGSSQQSGEFVMIKQPQYSINFVGDDWRLGQGAYMCYDINVYNCVWEKTGP